MKTVEIPQVHVLSEVVVDTPVVAKRQATLVQKAQKTAEVPHPEEDDKDVNVPVGRRRKVRLSQKVQSTVEIPQAQYIPQERVQQRTVEQIIDVLVAQIMTLEVVRLVPRQVVQDVPGCGPASGAECGEVRAGASGPSGFDTTSAHGILSCNAHDCTKFGVEVTDTSTPQKIRLLRAVTQEAPYRSWRNAMNKSTTYSKERTSTNHEKRKRNPCPPTNSGVPPPRQLRT